MICLAQKAHDLHVQGKFRRDLAPVALLACSFPDKAGIIDMGDDGVLNIGDAVVYHFEVNNTGHTCIAVMEILDDNVGNVEFPDLEMSGNEPLMLQMKHVQRNNKFVLVEVRHVVLFPYDSLRMSTSLSCAGRLSCEVTGASFAGWCQHAPYY